MTKINAYLTFNGNCREAMNFYQECLGGELYFLKVGESPMSDKMPTKMKDCILHSTLRNDTIVLQGSDMTPDAGLIKGNNVSLMLVCSSEEEIKTFYAKLSVGGQVTQPLDNTFWGALFGTLNDQFGNHWIFNFDKNAKK